MSVIKRFFLSEDIRSTGLPLFVVIVAGALGAGLTYASGFPSQILSSPFFDNSPGILLLLHSAFGALTSVVVVFLVANTDRGDVIRLVALSLLTGVFWSPSLNAAQAARRDYNRQDSNVEGQKAGAELFLKSVSPTEIDQTSFNLYLDEYQKTLKNTTYPWLKSELQNDPAIEGLFKNAVRQDWFKIEDYRNIYPSIDFDALVAPPAEGVK